MIDWLRIIAAAKRRHPDNHVDVAMAVEGQISRAESKKLIELARDVPQGTVIVEIGTFRGRSTIALALGSISGNANRVYAVDPHLHFEGIFGGHFGPNDQAVLYHNLVQAGVGHIVAVVSLPSQAAAQAWTQRNVGLLWIDGDHRYAGVSADYYCWVPFVIPDGLIVVHDRSAPGVAQLIGELLSNGRLVPSGNLEGLSWFRQA
jgi:predicted O-methyltransferase YrrM